MHVPDALIGHPAVVAGDLDTGLVERHLDELVSRAGVPDDVLTAAALVLHREHVPAGSADPWDVPDGWRLGEAAWTVYRLESRDGVHELRVRGLPASGAEVLLSGGLSGDGAGAGAETVPALLADEGDDLLVTLGETARRYAVARDGDTVWLGRDGDAWAFTHRHLGDPGDRAGAGGPGDGLVRSPMPGTVLVVKVAAGDRVTEGQPLLIVEAMKMEHTVTAPIDGVVAELRVRTGQAVGMDAVLAVVGGQER
ncbi:biotin/lipoyl-containing protein [Streptosporangium sp. NPDC006013]|uniref:acetyl-CoA carboxylase biotin carboxyl carrier protein subunit n=1 Tax=Streptosporangium sp. NPDC006013 TaxID=3155596 RepID=UPI0033BDC7B1